MGIGSGVESELERDVSELIDMISIGIESMLKGFYTKNHNE